MLKATDLTRAPLFDAVSFVLDDGERAGLVGPNGAGKTTLLRILAGLGRADRGAAAAGAHDRVGYLPQDVPDRRGSVGDLVGRSAGEAWTVRAELDRLEDRLAAGDASEATLAAYGRAQARFDALGGWALEARLDEVLRRLDVAHLDRRTPLARLSGGEAARVMLAGVLLAAPTVLLLDEPTNHLDLDGLAWLEEFLCGFGGTLLVVSHDRRFLDETVQQVLELDGTGGGLTAYAGGYTDYREERERRRRRLELELEAQEKRRRRLAGDIERTRGFARRSERAASGGGADKQRRYAKKVAAKAKARERRLEREMSSDDWVRPPRRPTPFKVRLEGREDGRRLVAALRGVRAVRGGRAVLDDVDLTLHGGERMALVGPNGAGKSTLLDVLAGALAPAAGTADLRVPGRLLPQTPGALPLERSVLDWFRDRVALEEGAARTLLAHYRFDEHVIDRPLGRLSPGERSRLHVATIVAAGAELVLLDEPTNHLDFDTLDVVEGALRAFAGTLVVATHDRALLEAIGVERIVEVRDGGVRERTPSALRGVAGTLG